MNRNVYDTDCLTWSPQGRIFQIEYAAESVKQGTCVLGVKNNTHVILCALRRSVSKLAEFNSKIMKIDDHCGATFSGISADAVLMVQEMRKRCMIHKYQLSTPAEVEKVVDHISHVSQKNTQQNGKRPFGVGLLISGYDRTGTHIFETLPSGDYVEYKATAFGSRCQSAKTYLETNLEAIQTSDSIDKLLTFALRAMAASMSAEMDMTGETLHVAVVGKDTPFRGKTVDT
eukprot:Protomagalhaensia_wolfi_Nauph_80__662@NODE_1379_length_1556_cov_447_025709_g841_i1_p1_GENE_NODE_1379_length_1556_cov_447_025709_g841_i1NODE_1379_length_1556_cov_447_025709_g841_i1_p1_ORF_typecomplete_len230_score37_09Proteasome/PF00227_26/1_2e39Proteasome_A_N/PF10584_9/3e09DUF3612/PF12268_8/0_16_NODE_1379_length_1556_cov_447_025709_g841_i160749